MECENRKKFGIILMSISIIVIVLFCCCTQPRRETIRIAGSTTVQPISLKAAEIFMERNPNVMVSVLGGGSGTGIKMVAEGSVDIGASSRELKDEEKAKYPDLVAKVMARDAIAIVVNPKNPVNDLTLEQIRDIFSGKIRNWKEVGGEDKEIVVVVREIGSGTRATFEEIVMRGVKIREDALQKPSNGAVKAKISENENAIGYIGLGYVDSSVKALKVDGVYPSKENVRSGKYKLVRNLYYITKGEPSGITKEFIDFVLSEEGQKIVEEEGFISVA